MTYLQNVILDINVYILACDYAAEVRYNSTISANNSKMKRTEIK